MYCVIFWIDDEYFIAKKDNKEVKGTEKECLEFIKAKHQAGKKIEYILALCDQL